MDYGVQNQLKSFNSFRQSLCPLKRHLLSMLFRTISQDH